MLMNNGIISLIIVSSLLAMTGTPNKSVTSVHASTINTYDFENISEKESVEFVLSHDIAIPTKLKESKNLGRITKSIVNTVINNYDCSFAYSYGAMQRYAEDIKNAIQCTYYFSNKKENLIRDAYTLQYNTVKDSNGNWVTSGGAWNSRWYNYNCYAYSIHRNEETPFYPSWPYIQYQPGNMSGSGDFGSSDSIDDLATIVKNDLEAIGYTNVILSASIPTITNSQELICVRMCEEDYHFMRYDLETNSWYHKPGSTAVLKYNYTPNNNILWYCEYSYEGEEGSDYSPIYDSDIVFIKYNKNRVDISASTYNLSGSVNVNQGKDSILEINNSTNGARYQISLSSSYAIETELYDYDMTLLNTYSGSNFSFYKFLSNERYYLKMNYSSNNALGSITYNISHYHSYDSPYLWWSLTQHRSTCVCGSTQLEPHVVAPGSYNFGDQTAQCILCGGPASFGIWPASTSSLPTSSNGSYICPNGVIVLVEEDIQAYLDGILIFNYLNSN